MTTILAVTLPAGHAAMLVLGLSGLAFTHREVVALFGSPGGVGAFWLLVHVEPTSSVVHDSERLARAFGGLSGALLARGIRPPWETVPGGVVGLMLANRVARASRETRLHTIERGKAEVWTEAIYPVGFSRSVLVDQGRCALYREPSEGRRFWVPSPEQAGKAWTARTQEVDLDRPRPSSPRPAPPGMDSAGSN